MSPRSGPGDWDPRRAEVRDPQLESLAPSLTPRLRRLLVAYVLFVVAAGACVLEAGVRLLGLAPRLTPQYVHAVGDPYLPYKPRPLSVRTSCSEGEFCFEHRHNSLGFRDQEHDLAKPAGTFRVLGLGDSFTYGRGAAFEDTYLKVLEDRLNARAGDHPRIEIIKAGIPGFFPEPERILLEHYGLSFAPDLVLVAFLPNDLLDTYRGVDALTFTKTGDLATREAARLGDVAAWLYVHSHLLRIFLQAHVSRRIARHTAWIGTAYAPGEAYEEQWRKIEGEYLTMRELADSVGARLVIVHISDNLPGSRHRGDPGARLAAWCVQHGIPFVDTLPAMEHAETTERLYWSGDAHCNADGCRVIADVLYDELTRRALVP